MAGEAMHTGQTSAEDGGQAELAQQPQDVAMIPDMDPEPEPEQQLEPEPGPRPALEPETESTKHGVGEEEGAATSKPLAPGQKPQHQHAPAGRNASQTLVSNSGLYEREISRRAEMLARIDAQRQQKQHAEMKDVTFSPRINPALPTVGQASKPGTSRAAELKKEETAARVANGFWPITPVADRKLAAAGIRPVISRTGSGRVVSGGGAGEAAAPRLTRGIAAAVEPRRDPMEYAKKLQEKKLRAEQLRAEHKGR